MGSSSLGRPHADGMAGRESWTHTELVDNAGLCIEFCQDNPKKAGSLSHQRYEAYKVAKTIGESIRFHGGTSQAVRDWQNDCGRGFVKVAGQLDSAAKKEAA